MVEMNTKPRIQFDAQQTIPLVSFMLIVLCASVYVMAAGAHSGDASDLWITNHCFNGVKASTTWNESIQLLGAGLKGTPGAFGLFSTHITDLVQTCFLSAFASADRWQVVINCYLLWVFGASMEQRIGLPRFFMVVLMAVLAPWLVVGFEAAHDASSTYYGPFFLLATLVGASFVFPPEKKINTEWFKSARGDIFAKQDERDVMERYQFKPMMFLSLFVALEAGIYFYNLGLFKYVEAHHPGLKTVAILGAAFAIILGYVVVSLIVWSATGSLKDGPMRLVTVKMYNDILKLDVGHETAIKGTAHALGLPPERVKEWVMKQKGKMRLS